VSLSLLSFGPFQLCLVGHSCCNWKRQTRFALCEPSWLFVKNMRVQRLNVNVNRFIYSNVILLICVCFAWKECGNCEMQIRRRQQLSDWLKFPIRGTDDLKYPWILIILAAAHRFLLKCTFRELSKLCEKRSCVYVGTNPWKDKRKSNSATGFGLLRWSETFLTRRLVAGCKRK